MISDQNKFRALSKEYAEVEPVVKGYESYRQTLEDIEEATKNRTAREVLSNLRKVLAVDSSLMSESVKEAVLDGKTQIDELTSKVTELEKENGLLKEAYNKQTNDSYSAFAH